MTNRIPYRDASVPEKVNQPVQPWNLPPDTMNHPIRRSNLPRSSYAVYLFRALPGSNTKKYADE